MGIFDIFKGIFGMRTGGTVKPTPRPRTVQKKKSAVKAPRSGMGPKRPVGRPRKVGRPRGT